MIASASTARVAFGREPLVPSGVLAMLIFVLTEIMFFAGMVSALIIARSGSVTAWPPLNQPRLPVEATAVNTVALLASGVLLFVAGRAFRREPARAARPLVAAITLGAVFVLVQGAEWAALIHEGLTIHTSVHGSFFYLIVGTHALHAVVAIGALVWVYGQLRRNLLTTSQLWTAQVLWYFVVGVWPVLYVQVYL